MFNFLKSNKKIKLDVDPEKVEDLLSRSVKEVLPSKEELREKLLSGERLKLYIGTDSTGSSLHLGHATNYMILEKFRRMGHEVVLLIGDFTSRIGDPTDKSDSARKQLSREEVVSNVKTWLDQIRPILDIDNKDNPVEVVYNHDWLSKMSFEDVIDLASNFTVQQMIERDMFQVRINKGQPLYLHEMFYPLMQGYDSVALGVDLEVCGSDQKFNALAGRTLLKKIKNKEKFVFITTLLENPVTKEKMMSKSKGTGVYLDWGAEKMYGAVMAQDDDNMNQLFIDATWLSKEEIEDIKKEKTNPRDLKMRLAMEITKIYHGEDGAQSAQESFIKTFQKRGVPEDILEIEVSKDTELSEILLKEKMISSKSEWKRLVEGGGVSLVERDEKIKDLHYLIPETGTYKIGKRRWIKVKIK